MYNQPHITVIIPAHNEETSIEFCIASVAKSDVNTRIFVSNNFSTDGTGVLLEESPYTFNKRDLPCLMNFVSHIVDSGRWALRNSDSQYFCFLAADDLFSTTYVSDSFDILETSSDFSMTFPSVEWFSGNIARNRIFAPNLSSKIAVYRQFKALIMTNSTEIGNQMYGVFNRSAFECLIDRFEEYGECFGADLLSTVSTLRDHRSIPIRDAFILRRVREGADLRTRVGYKQKSGSSPLLVVSRYFRLHFAINRALAISICRAKNWPITLVCPWIQIIRFPQILLEIPGHVVKRLE